MYSALNKNIWDEILKNKENFIGSISVKNKDNNSFTMVEIDGDEDDIEKNMTVIGYDDEKKEDSFELNKKLYVANQNIEVVAVLGTRWSSIWASYGATLPPISFLHAKNFNGEIYCTDVIEYKNGDNIFEKAGCAILNKFKYRGLTDEGAVFVRGLGAVVWGKTISETLKKANILEELCFRVAQVRSMNDGQFCYVPYELSKKLYNKN